MLNKRVLATAILSLSIAAPTVSNLSPIAQAAPSHLGCGKQVVEDAGFKGDVSIVVAKHLKVSCGLSVQQIAQLSDHELTQVIEELGISKAGFNPALVRAAAGTIDQNTDKPGNGGGTDDLDRDYQTGVSVDRIKAGARTVTGTVYLQADQDEQKISAALPRRNFVTVTAKKKNPGKAELVKFEIPVPESLQLREHHQVFVYTGEGAPTPQRIRNGGAMLLVEAEGSGDGEGSADGADDGAQTQQTQILIDEIAAGAKTITGRVKLPEGVSEQKIAAFFPRSLFAQVSVQSAQKDAQGFANFEIAVPESLNLRVGDQVKIGSVGKLAEIQTVVVKA
ncbi:hypothetical protein [Corynebacterium propinquum]|uniref:hypothetical protein n=3 Tax=Corynebacterium propinquum TaxID=43769 RepID=UPI00254ECFC5|nr:hypothetical protein [Corynebacterium propinquum]MDK8535089.1 hypothetical protein [Corynebacterium propinquum]MDK8665303.1 hypothetical protein [Corynebacterium propinquum]